jgi:hypothetical protein
MNETQELISEIAGYRPKIQVEDPWLPKDLWREVVKGLWVGGTLDSDTIDGVMKGETKPKVIGYQISKL